MTEPYKVLNVTSYRVTIKEDRILVTASIDKCSKAPDDIQPDSNDEIYHNQLDSREETQTVITTPDVINEHNETILHPRPLDQTRPPTRTPVTNHRHDKFVNAWHTVQCTDSAYRINVSSNRIPKQLIEDYCKTLLYLEWGPKTVRRRRRPRQALSNFDNANNLRATTCISQPIPIADTRETFDQKKTLKQRKQHAKNYRERLKRIKTHLYRHSQTHQHHYSPLQRPKQTHRRIQHRHLD